jgi:hypothetical protein
MTSLTCRPFLTVLLRDSPPQIGCTTSGQYIDVEYCRKSISRSIMLLRSISIFAVNQAQEHVSELARDRVLLTKLM